MRAFSCESGFSLMEMIVTLGLLSLLGGVAVSNIKELDDPLKNATDEMIGFMKKVRARGISTTSAYQIYPDSSTAIRTRYSSNCGDAAEDKINDPAIVLNLPEGAFLGDTDWAICFSARGLPDSNIQIIIEDNDGEDRTIEVFLGGAVKEVAG